MYLTKFLLDNILEEPFNPSYDDDHFMGMANVGDIDLFIGNVLIPTLLVDKWMDDTYKTPGEMAKTFDYLDWSAGLKIQQTRVKPPEDDKRDCGSQETSGMIRWFAAQRYGKCSITLPWEAPDELNCALSQTHLFGECYKWDLEIAPNNVGSVISKADFGHNWTHHDQPLYEPWVYFTPDELGTNPAGQDSASETATYNSLPTDGFVAVVIPFFSAVLLPDQAPHVLHTQMQYADMMRDARLTCLHAFVTCACARLGGARVCIHMYACTCNMCMCMHVCLLVCTRERTCPKQEGRGPQEVLDYREYAYNVTRGAAPPSYFCLRLSRNGVAVKQLCDPNDEATDRTTGRVAAEVQAFWAEMKAGRFIDHQTRLLALTLPVRANHANVKTRLTMMLQLTSLGGVLPSFEFQSRLDTVD